MRASDSGCICPGDQDLSGSEEESEILARTQIHIYRTIGARLRSLN